MISCVAALAGCAGHAPHALIAETIATVPESRIAGRHEIFIATTRARAKDPRVAYTGQRSDMMTFARVDVSVPASHEPGKLERPGNDRIADPARYFTATGLGGYGTADAFASALRGHIAAHNGRALVFIHGFNTSFDSAVYRMTQLVHDSGYDGTAVLFTWPSAGRTLDYVYDSNSAAASRDALVETLRRVADAGARRIDIIAHSMGTWLTMESLRQLAIVGNRDLDDRLGDVVLASPDIDVDVFKSQMRRYGQPDKPFLVLTSANDRALTLSGFIAGNRPRVGDYNDAQELANLGVIVVDASALSAGDRLNHTKFADNPVLVKLLGERLTDPDAFGESEEDITTRIDALARGVGQTIGSAAEIVITTPLEVLNIAVGGN